MELSSIKRNIAILISHSRCNNCYKPFDEDCYFTILDLSFFVEKEYFNPRGYPNTLLRLNGKRIIDGIPAYRKTLSLSKASKNDISVASISIECSSCYYEKNIEYTLF